MRFGETLERDDISLNRLCERSAAIHTMVQRVDCRVAALLAKTKWIDHRSSCYNETFREPAALFLQ